MAIDDQGESLRSLCRMLEEVVADRSLLDVLTLEERMRLLAAAGNVFNPDADARRRRAKEERRREKADKRQREQAGAGGDRDP